MKRLFIAVELPQPIRFMLHSMGRGIPNSRPVKEEQIHLTMRFIGEVEGNVFKDIQERLTAIKHPPFSIVMKGVGHFPPRGKPRVIWVGVEPKGELLKLRNRIEKTLTTCGIEPEGRKYMPHVTLARLNNTPLKRVGEFLSGNSFFQTETFTVESFHLFSSKLTSKGAIHFIEQSYPLVTTTI